MEPILILIDGEIFFKGGRKPDFGLFQTFPVFLSTPLKLRLGDL